VQKMRGGVRSALHRPQCHIQGDFKSLGGGTSNSLRSESGKRASDQLDGCSHDIGETCCQPWMFE
jgi:hypothetical protein